METNRHGQDWNMGPHADTSRGVPVAQKECKDIVLSVVAGLGDQGQIRRVRAAVGVACTLLVGVGTGKRVAQAAGPLKHFALIVGAISDLQLRANPKATSDCAPQLVRFPHLMHFVTSGAQQTL
jgi:hypothetical protein